MRLCSFKVSYECGSLVDLSLRIAANRSLNFGGSGSLVTDGIRHYEMPAFDLISASETVVSSGLAR